jgi:hypothetical protein
MDPAYVSLIEIYRSTDGINYTIITAAAPTATSYTNSGLLNFQQYYYQIRYMLTPGSYSPFSNTLHTITQNNITVTSSVVNNWDNITIQYTTSSRATGYKIERSTDNVNFTQIAEIAPTNTYTDTSCNATSVDYYYRVKAVNGPFTGNSANSLIASKSPDLITFFTYKARVEADSPGNLYYDTPRATVDSYFLNTIAWARTTRTGSYTNGRFLFPAFAPSTLAKISRAYCLDPLSPSTVINFAQTTNALQPEQADFRAIQFYTSSARRMTSAASNFTNTSATGWGLGFWMYNGTPASRQCLFNKGGTASTPGTNGFRLQQETTRELRFEYNASTVTLGSSVIPINTWTHVFISVVGTNVYLHLNGYYVSTTALPVNADNISTSTVFVIGSRGEGTNGPYGGQLGHIVFLEESNVGAVGADSRVVDLYFAQLGAYS